MNLLVVGAGAWGTAFAVHLCRSGHTVTLAPRRFEQALRLTSARENSEYLPGIALPPNLQIVHELPPALMEVEVVLLACPSQALRATCEGLRRARTGATRWRAVVSLTKGLELGTQLRPTEVISSVLPEMTAMALTGPTNALEVAKGRPAAMVLASSIDPLVTELQSALSGPSLRVYTSEDVAGVEFGSCLKNIYAIAAGCSEGLGLGDNARAALLTRALTEMVRVGTALGARAETFYGLSGFGDLVATCYGGWSRNREFGSGLGAGKTVAALLAGRKTVIEGYQTTRAFADLCVQRQIDAPILQEMRAVLFEEKSPSKVLASLMGRGLKKE